MKTTVDIPREELEDAMKFAGAKTKREAIVTALTEYNRRKRMAELVKYSAVSDTFLSNEELETLDADLPGEKKAPQDRKRRKR